MEILGRAVSEEYESLRASVDDELVVTVRHMALPSEGPPQAGKPFLFGRSNVDLNASVARVWLNLELPDDAFSHTAAHELAHVLQTLRGFYKTSTLSQLPNGSAEENAAVYLSEATECIAVDRWIATFGLEATYSVAFRNEFLREEIRKGQRMSLPPGSPGFAISALRYVRAALEQSPDRLERLRRGFELKRPGVVSMAEDLRRRVAECGLTTVEERRDAMLILRNGLGLQGKVFIVNRFGDRL